LEYKTAWLNLKMKKPKNHTKSVFKNAKTSFSFAKEAI
jgi:hypothetical protein